MFVVRQITEEPIEYNKAAYAGFIEVTKASHRIQIEDLLHVIYLIDIPSNIIQTIESINTHIRM